jgi:UDP-N-acetyl-D-glucosamine dehydrogenase
MVPKYLSIGYWLTDMDILPAVPRPGRDTASFVLSRLRARQATVGIIGLGYVGLPLARAACASGFRVLGFDIDPEKAAALNAGRSYIREITDVDLRAMRKAGFKATAGTDRLGEPDAILICVPTPLGRHREPDLTFVVKSAEAVAAALRCGQLVVLESTSFPGTTREVVRPILEKGGLRCGRDFFLAYSPEREDPGNPTFATHKIPKVVGADDGTSRELAVALYEGIVERVVPVSSADAAEAVKIVENVFRAVNIALANEFKVIFTQMGIDVWEVIGAASTKPFGYMPFHPGPGLGGHCIPIDPFYLSWRAREFGLGSRFIELAGEINTAMPPYVIGRLTEALDARFAKGLNGSRILILGVAYKRNIDDIRESPAFVILELLDERGASVDYHDPFVPEIQLTREHPRLAGRRSVPLDGAMLAGYDAVVIVTDHDSIDYDAIVKHSRLVVDTRNATVGLADDRIVGA